jgi:ArsR family transcriptional regulator
MKCGRLRGRQNSENLRPGLALNLYFHNYQIMEKQNVISALAALAQETRLDLFRLLVQSGPEGMSPSAISEVLGVPSATLSFHLKELKSAGLIRCQRAGRSRIYSPDFEAVQSLLGFLTQNCCQGVGAERGADVLPGCGDADSGGGAHE